MEIKRTTFGSRGVLFDGFAANYIIKKNDIFFSKVTKSILKHFLLSESYKFNVAKS